MPSLSGTLQLTVKSREKVLFQDSVTSISSTNQKGIFDILPFHSNFITLVNQKVTVKTQGGQTQELVVNNGIMRVSENKVEIFLGVTTEVETS